MNVLDCIDEFKSLGEKAFRKPLNFSTMRSGLDDRTKYKAARWVDVFKDITARRNKDQSDNDLFPSGQGMCKT